MEDLVKRLLGLLEGVEAHYTCTCTRRLRVGLSPELWETVARLKAYVSPEALTSEEASRFALLEVDR